MTELLSIDVFSDDPFPIFIVIGASLIVATIVFLIIGLAKDDGFYAILCGLCIGGVVACFIFDFISQSEEYEQNVRDVAQVLQENGYSDALDVEINAPATLNEATFSYAKDSSIIDCKLVSTPVETEYVVVCFE